MKAEPRWLSQGELFRKLPHDLFVLWSSNFSAHTHKDSLLFKKSVMEQRMRFYGNKRLNDIIYGNSRNARDPPGYISGDETITRMYTRKATDIRMRTSKKNESGILNQNLCGSNEGYTSWRKGDPKGAGYTFVNVAYPGASYNIGSMFRERDMGNLLQLIFVCGDYFRYRNVELVCDSHFGHIVPIAFLRLWKVFSTCSFSAIQRIGTNNLPELSKKQMSKEDLQTLLGARNETIEIAGQPERDIFASDTDVDEYKEYEKKKLESKEFLRVKTRIKFFEKEMSEKNKGAFKVWKTELFLQKNFKINIYLHAVLDSKVVYRISNRYGALPLVTMNVTDKDAISKKKGKFPYRLQPPIKPSE